MQLQVVRTQEEFDALADEWNQLLDCSASHVPFLRHEYMSAWWRTLGGGEWKRGELHIVITRHTDGSLCGIAPLFFSDNLDGEPALLLLGSIEISDYLDFITCHEHTASFVDRLLDHLASPHAPAWKALDFYNLLEDSPTLAALEASALRQGWKFTSQRLQHCPYIPLPGDWETYLAGIEKKQRHEIRRKMRRAESYEEPVRWYIVQDESSLDSEIEAFLELMAQDPGKAEFLTGEMRSHMRLAAQNAFREGWLQLAFLEVNGKKAAGYYNFDYQNHIWVYNSGIDFSFGTLSPGWVLLGRLLQWANENKRQAFDFMRGDEEYKYRFGGIDRFVMRATIRR